MSLIETLTQQQEALIPVYREKWKAIALSTEPINHEKATEAVKAVYDVVGLPKPKIIFCDSPYSAFHQLDSSHLLSYKSSLKIDDLFDPLRIEEYYYFNNGIWQQSQYLENDVIWRIKPDFDYRMRNKVSDLITGDIRNKLYNEFYEPLWEELDFQLRSPLKELGYEHFGITKLRSCFYPRIGWYDFVLSVMISADFPNPWRAYVSLAESCGWIFPGQELCVVCDRPRILSFDNKLILHAEGSPAMQFADGFSIYAYHGVTLPKKYGKLHPTQWQAQWLLEETNAELRRVLIQGIGYERIGQELQANELDSWQEYTLLKIDNHIDIEPIYLLKMTCPSTGFIHALRVPPDLKTAREAIRWRNWGIDPEAFSVQT